MPALAGAASLQEKFSDELDDPPRTFSCRLLERRIDCDPSRLVKFICPVSDFVSAFRLIHATSHDDSLSCYGVSIPTDEQDIHLSFFHKWPLTF